MYRQNALNVIYGGGGGATIYISNPPPPPPPTVLVHDIHITSSTFPRIQNDKSLIQVRLQRDFLINSEVGLLYHLDFILPPARNAWFRV